MKEKTAPKTNIVSEKRIISEMLKYYHKRESKFFTNFPMIIRDERPISYYPICSLVGNYLQKKSVEVGEAEKFHKDTHRYMKKLYPNLAKALDKIRKKSKPAFKIYDRLFGTIQERISFLEEFEKTLNKKPKAKSVK